MHTKKMNSPLHLINRLSDQIIKLNKLMSITLVICMQKFIFPIYSMSAALLYIQGTRLDYVATMSIYTERAGLTVVNDSIVQEFLHHGHRLFSRFHFALLQKPVHHVVANEAVFVDA